MKNIIFVAGMMWLLMSCTEKKLPVLGSEGYTIPPFKFVNQEGKTVDNQTFAGKIYVADFFFGTCPTICPVVKREMLRVYAQYKNNPEVLFLSHSLDPKNDTVAFLKQYAENLGANSKQWHFITGAKEDIYDIGQKGYMVTAMDDTTAAGGILHDGRLILVDKKQRIRGYYIGTDPQEVDKLMKDMAILLKEKD